MPDIVCSLKNALGQDINPGGYQILAFPYGVLESHDPLNMHPAAQPDGVVSVFPDQRSGLIWPAHAAWADLHALIYWEEPDEEHPYTELRDQFVRDPLGLSTGPDSTCTEDRPLTPGGQYRAKSWAFFVDPGTPVAVMVRHNAPVPVRVTLAEFKLSYRIDA